LPYYFYIYDKKYAYTYQSDRADILEEARHDSNLLFHLKTNKRAMAPITFNNEVFKEEAVTASFYNTVLNDSFTILQIFGPSECGKSELAKTKALELSSIFSNIKGIESNIVTVFSKDEARKWPKKLHRGDIIICDEQGYQSGQDSVTSEKALHSILKACRKYGVSFIFCDPELQPKPNVAYVLRVVRTVRALNITHSLVYSPRSKVIGWDFSEIPFDNELFKEYFADYNDKKDEYMDSLTNQDGQIGTNLSTKQIEIAKELYEYAKKKGRKITYRRLETYIVDKHWEHLTYTTKQNIIQRVLDMDNDEDESTFISVTEQTESNGNIQDFREAVFDKMLELGAKEKHIEAFRRFCDGEKARDIGDSYGVGASAVSNWIQELQHKLGDAFEIVYSQYLKNKGIENQRAGGSTNEPDIVASQNGKPIAVYSLKCRNDSRVKKYTFHQKDFGNAEKEMSKKYQIPLYLVFFDIYNNALYEPIENDGREDFVFSLRG